MRDAQAALVVFAPVPGRVVRMADVPEPVFAASLLGPGAAVDPIWSPHRAVGPVGRAMVKLHPHVYVVVTQGGPLIGYERIAARSGRFVHAEPYLLEPRLVALRTVRALVMPDRAIKLFAQPEPDKLLIPL